ncbi:MAG: XdhC family protein [Acidimicrobiia bacterium]
MTPLEAIEHILGREEYGVVVTFVEGPNIGEKAVLDATGSILAGSIPEPIGEPLTTDAMTLMEHEQHRTVGYDEHEVFIETLAPPQELVIFGAVHIAQSLASFGSMMGYRVTVVDSRPAFATADRFPGAEVLVGWPTDLIDQIPMDRRTWLVILSHEKRFEDPVLEAALNSPVRYVGTMGSRRTQDLREERLRDKGFSDEAIARIHGPVGLDIGAESPQEVAVSILAEMTLVRYGHGTGMSLHGVEGRVHKQRHEES